VLKAGFLICAGLLAGAGIFSLCRTQEALAAKMGMAATISVSVTDERTGRPIEGAEVCLVNSDWNANVTPIRQYTDKKGQAFFIVEDDRYDISVSKGKYTLDGKETDFYGNSVVEDFTVTKGDLESGEVISFDCSLERK
jgi:5-hydroxyisourate hydrolase-like protein (transthyretin family)